MVVPVERKKGNLEFHFTQLNIMIGVSKSKIENAASEALYDLRGPQRYKISIYDY